MNLFYSKRNAHLSIASGMVIAFTALFSLGAVGNPLDSSRVRKTILKGRAVLPAATFAPGPTSGKLIASSNGQTFPLINKQPVQGFSAIHRENDSIYWVMPDNGFGALENSADAHLRVYHIRPIFKTKDGGSGEIKIKKYIELRDPNKLIPFTIVNHFTAERILTGADFDIESMQKAKDNTLWFGDEFGPYLIHTDTTGKVLEAPYVLPDPYNPGKEIRSPQNQYYEEASAIRIMNAMNTSAKMYGGTKTPVLSPNHNLINDANPATGLPNRINPAVGSGLEMVSSEIFTVASIKSAGYPVVAWTVNDSLRMIDLIKLGVNGIISDNPELLRNVVYTYDGTDAGSEPDFIGTDGLIDIKKFDAQGHRGGRSLRPENSFPAFEVAMDNLMTTLELDCGVTSDLVAILGHDPYLPSARFRKVDGTTYSEKDEILIKDHTAADIQSKFIGDKLLPNFPLQKNAHALSPVAVEFVKSIGLVDPYVTPTLGQVFEFVKFYAAYYKAGAGSTHPLAALRSLNAEKIRFNVETKRHPRTDVDPKGNIYKTRTVDSEPFARAVASAIVSNTMTDRADIQSFDFSTLVVVHRLFPEIQTVCLFSDGPRLINGGGEDGTNLQPEPNTTTSPWLAGMYWPYRSTYLTTPTRSPRSGGFEGLALDSAKENLLPLLELPLTGGEPGKILMFTFNLATKSYTENYYTYRFNPRGTNIGDFVMYTKTRGLIIERDGSSANLNGTKAIYEIQLNGTQKNVSKRLVADLLNIRDTFNLTTPVAGDLGLGPIFSFPFETIEDVVVLGPSTLGVLNDNNYPGSVGRHITPRVSDDNEFIIIELDRPLATVPMSRDDTLGYYPEAKPTGFIETLKEEKFITGARPNPFTNSTIVTILLPQSVKYSIAIFNHLGQKIKNVVEGATGNGIIEIEWNGMDDNQIKLLPGIYNLQLSCNGKVSNQKLMLKE